MIDLARLTREPNALAPHYGRFRVAERLLLTGHSHQAWPDCSFEAQQQAWLDAAEHVDAKWERAFARADEVRAGYRRLLDDPDGHIALGANTHELVVRWLSALPLAERPRLVTTDGEFHTIRRQLDRLAEAGLEIARVAAHPASGLAERLGAAVDARTAAVLVSSVLFMSGHIVPGLGDVLAACRRVGAELLIDAYHALGVVPFSVAGAGLGAAWIVGGGYKYCQLGEGNCFLRTPPDTRLRPVVTGWFSEFTALSEPARGRVVYGDGADRFAGSTYDPTSHYRAARVFAFFRERGLDAQALRAVSQHQVRRLAGRFDALDLDPTRITRDRTADLAHVGGFLVLTSPHAGAVQRALAARGVATDHRGASLCLGPAPYLCDRQLDDAITALDEAVPAACR